MNGRRVVSDVDCADCICRVCAVSALNDCQNRSVEKVCYPCNNCDIGDLLYETESDCPDFTCDEEDI